MRINVLSGSVALVCLMAVCGLTQAGAIPVPIVANRNLTPAGKLEGGVLNVQLEIRDGAWHPEAEDGPQLFVQAFGEAGHPSQIPGPMLRMPQGTTVHVTVNNQLGVPATVFGLHSRPGDGKDELLVPAGQSRDRTFLAGTPGTYYYWARTTAPRAIGDLGVLKQPVFEDTHLNGAFIVDPSGDVIPDRVFVINTMLVPNDVVHQDFEVVTINGKSYPYTEPLEYTAGDTVRWRVINPSFSEHPMHLHGAFYKVLSLGDSESDTQFASADRQTVVTQDTSPGSTMLMEWSPEHVGRWLFHCHFQFHFSKDERLPSFTPFESGDAVAAEPAMAGHHHDSSAMPGMLDMAGLVLTINVRDRAVAKVAAAAPAEVRKIDLVIEPNVKQAANDQTFACSVREGKKLVVSNDRTVGPPIVVTRGEATEITVVNRLSTPTSIHWHGIELESYYDGVVGGGSGDQVTPAIAPGGSFVAHFTPSRAGTFIYHTHSADPLQLSGGVYGGLIVLEPGESYDPDHDKLLVIGTRDTFFDAKRITINGAEAPAPMTMAPGGTYRLRLINMAPNLLANFRLGTEQQPATWREVAKDGTNVPTRLGGESSAVLHIVSGETYDFEFRAASKAEIPFEILNPVSQAKLVSKIVVQ